MKKYSISQTAINGLILASVTIVTSLIVQFVSTSAIINTILNLAKTVGSIYLLWFFIAKLAAKWEEITSKELFRYGMWTSLFSSIICAGYQLLIMSIAVSPENMDDTINESLSIIEESGMNVTAEMSDQLFKMAESLPQYTFIFTLIWCFVIGLIVSKISSSSLKKVTPFSNIE